MNEKITHKEFEHFFNQLWHSYHAKYNIPYAHNDKHNFCARVWNWLTTHEKAIQERQANGKKVF